MWNGEVGVRSVPVAIRSSGPSASSPVWPSSVFHILLSVPVSLSHELLQRRNRILDIFVCSQHLTVSGSNKPMWKDGSVDEWRDGRTPCLSTADPPALLPFARMRQHCGSFLSSALRRLAREAFSPKLCIWLKCTKPRLIVFSEWRRPGGCSTAHRAAELPRVGSFLWDCVLPEFVS